VTTVDIGPDLLTRLERRRAAMVEDLAALVATESPSADRQALAGCAALVGEIGARLLGAPAEVLAVDGRSHLRWRRGSDGPLVLGHFDTVWPRGTIDRWPFAVRDAQASGPGAFDMKAGIVQGLHALAELPADRPVTLLLTSDEEIGSPSSRDLIAEEAARAPAVLVLEPSERGALKTARKGFSTYELRITGRAAHAGLDPGHGINAGIELAHQVLAVARLAGTGPSAATTVTPTVASAGTTSNTVPAAARLAVDVRAETAAEQERIDAAVRALRPALPGARLELAGGIDRPPLEPALSAALFALAGYVAAALGLDPPGSAHVGGASDGNITAALGVPTLDGLGAVGANAHAEGEFVVLDELPRRAALLAGLITGL